MRNPNTTKAYGFLRSKILTGEFQPGTFLSAQKLSKEIGISRTPLRDALRLLENDELVTIVPKLGAVVRTLTEDQFRDLLGYREALEVHTAGKAAELRLRHEVERLKSLLDAIRTQVETLVADAHDEEALRKLSAADQLFHYAILEIAKNSFIKKHFERMDILQKMTIPSLMHKWYPEGKDLQDRAVQALHEHVEIFEAIRDGDASRARLSMQTHMANTSAKIVFQRDLDLSQHPTELIASI